MIVTLMGKLPFSAKYSAMEVSKMRQLVLEMTLAMPSWMLRGLASHVSLRSRPTSSSLYLRAEGKGEEKSQGVCVCVGVACGGKAPDMYQRWSDMCAGYQV